MNAAVPSPQASATPLVPSPIDEYFLACSPGQKLKMRRSKEPRPRQLVSTFLTEKWCRHLDQKHKACSGPAGPLPAQKLEGSGHPRARVLQLLIVALFVPSTISKPEYAQRLAEASHLTRPESEDRREIIKNTVGTSSLMRAEPRSPKSRIPNNKTERKQTTGTNEAWFLQEQTVTF